MIEEREEDKMEALETVELVEGEATKTMRIGTTLSPEMRTRLVQFLKERCLRMEPRGHARHISRSHSA